MQSQPPPKGSLEELFRHHLLESEAAAVPPRPLVWEHIDNGLLQVQNEKYRRRLLAYRWGMAASLLLATLAGGGWWHSQQVATATLASASAQREAARLAVAGAVPAGPRTYASSSEAAPSAVASTVVQGSVNSSETRVSAGRALATSSATPSQAGHQQAAEATASQRLLAGRGTGRPAASTLAYASASAPAQQRHGASRVAGAMLPARSSVYSSNTYAIAATATPPSATSASAPQLDASAEATLLPGTVLGDNALAAMSATNRSGEDALATRLASLSVAPAAGLPTELAIKDLPAPSRTLLRSWRYGAEYTIGAFQPNIDFNRGATTYNTALGLNTISLTRAAAAEYRANLRPGLNQRLGLRATRWLGGRWSLSTGVELAQQEAYSATSAAFTGEQLADINSFAAVPSPGTSAGAGGNMVVAPRSLQESSFRYRSAGVPIELQYDNQAKSGLSFYGRLGVIVSALLNVRSEVAGNSEATRTYSLTSASTPYRRLTALLRGSAGVRYRPAGRTWGLNVGPTAEAGVQSMNAETDRSFWQQSRPYSVGIEAGIEFGGFKPVQ